MTKSVSRVTWPPTPFDVDRDAIRGAYAALRGSLAQDPLFIRDAEEYGVSLEQLDEKMASPPRKLAGEALWEWLEGADQYRYAGLLVLMRAFADDSATMLEGRVVVPSEGTRVIRGNVVIRGDLVVDEQAMLVVLGALQVEGAIIGSSHEYSLVAARSITCTGGVTAGELIAAERIVASGPFYFSGNQYSSRAPVFEGPVLVDFERANAFTKVSVKKRLKKWDFDAAARALGVENGDELAQTFRGKLLAAPT